MIEHIIEHLNPEEELCYIRDELLKDEIIRSTEKREFLKRRFGLVLFHMQRYFFALGHINENDYVLDAACGEGYGASSLAKKAAVRGIDKDEQVLAAARNKYGNNPKLKFCNVDLEKDAFDGPYDVVVSFETVEHLVDPRAFIKKIKQVSSKIIVSVPTHPTKHANRFHLHDFTMEEFRMLMREHHWRIIDELNQQGTNAAIAAIPEQYTVIIK